jgi:hypothetical protein
VLQHSAVAEARLKTLGKLLHEKGCACLKANLKWSRMLTAHASHGIVKYNCTSTL